MYRCGQLSSVLEICSERVFWNAFYTVLFSDFSNNDNLRAPLQRAVNAGREERFHGCRLLWRQTASHCEDCVIQGGKALMDITKKIYSFHFLSQLGSVALVFLPASHPYLILSLFSSAQVSLLYYVFSPFLFTFFHVPFLLISSHFPECICLAEVFFPDKITDSFLVCWATESRTMLPLQFCLDNIAIRFYISTEQNLFLWEKIAMVLLQQSSLCMCLLPSAPVAPSFLDAELQQSCFFARISGTL